MSSMCSLSRSWTTAARLCVRTARRRASKSDSRVLPASWAHRRCGRGLRHASGTRPPVWRPGQGRRRAVGLDRERLEGGAGGGLLGLMALGLHGVVSGQLGPSDHAGQVGKDDPAGDEHDEVAPRERGPVSGGLRDAERQCQRDCAAEAGPGHGHAVAPRHSPGALDGAPVDGPEHVRDGVEPQQPGTEDRHEGGEVALRASRTLERTVLRRSRTAGCRPG